MVVEIYPALAGHLTGLVVVYNLKNLIVIVYHGALVYSVVCVCVCVCVYMCTVHMIVCECVYVE